MNESLTLVTVLHSNTGCDEAAKIAKTARENELALKRLLLNSATSLRSSLGRGESLRTCGAQSDFSEFIIKIVVLYEIKNETGFLQF